MASSDKCLSGAAGPYRTSGRDAVVGVIRSVNPRWHDCAGGHPLCSLDHSD